MTTRFIRNIVLLACLGLLTACGGESNQEAANALPEADLTKSEALAALPTSSRDKVKAPANSTAVDFLGRLLDQPPSEVIAEFTDASTAGNTLEEKKAAYAKTKANVSASFTASDATSTAYEVVNDYVTLPSSFVRLKTRRALVKFLNHADVKAVYENSIVTASSFANANAAQSAGTVAVSEFITMARSANCSEFGNRLYLIDQKNVFWDVAGNCPDASYQRVLFGQTPGNPLCSESDSIFGPRTVCQDESARAMFTTILNNRNKPDLGLGSSHQVQQIVF